MSGGRLLAVADYMFLFFLMAAIPAVASFFVSAPSLSDICCITGPS